MARLRCTPEEEAVFASQLGRVVEYIDQLERFESGESAVSGPPRGAPVREAEDVPRLERLERLELPREAFLANAPASAFGEFLAVPEVKGGSGDDS